MSKLKDVPVSRLLATPGAPTVTPQGTGGAETWTYVVVALDERGNVTAASAGGSTAVGNATIDGTNFNRVTWTDVAGATSYNVYRTVSGGTPATVGLIGNVLQGVQVLDDTGLVGDASTAPTVNTTGDGDAVDVMHFDSKYIQLGGTFVATLQPQGTIDGVGWDDIGSALDATDIGALVAIAPTITAFRLKQTAYTSGTPTCKIQGFARG